MRIILGAILSMLAGTVVRQYYPDPLLIPMLAIWFGGVGVGWVVWGMEERK